MQFIRCILRLLRGHPFPLPFPLTPRQLDAFSTLNDVLEAQGTTSEDKQHAVQAVSWEMVCTPAEGSWENPFQVYFAMLALRVDGTYSDAMNLTPHLAKFTYWIRLTCLYIATELPVKEAVP